MWRWIAILVLILTAAGVLAVNLLTRHSATTSIRIGDKVAISYSVQWYFSGMTEALTVRQMSAPEHPITVASEIYKRAYWSGALIYSSKDGSILHLKLGFRFTGNLYKYTIASNSLEWVNLCPFKSIDASRSTPNQKPTTRQPIPSIYFPSQEYLGRFAIDFTKDRNRGSGVRFISPDAEPEPPLYEGECP